MTDQEKNELMRNLSHLSDEMNILRAELRDTEKEYSKLHFAFIQLLAEYTSLVERRNMGDANEIEYRYMDLSGLLDI